MHRFNYIFQEIITLLGATIQYLEKSNSTKVALIRPSVLTVNILMNDKNEKQRQ